MLAIVSGGGMGLGLGSKSVPGLSKKTWKYNI
jgi:hypothetical protein